MKNLYLTLVLFVSTFAFAQTNGITYQAIILNPQGEQLPGVNNSNAPLANKGICMSFKILNNSAQVVYQETIQTTTDSFGMVNLIIGTGSQIGGTASSFSTIVWDSTAKSLIVSLNADGSCSQFTEISNQPFTAVPFAFAANNAVNVTGVVAIANGGTGANNAASAKANLGLGNVDNTSDLSKPVSLAAQTALNLKENLSNKSITTSLGTSDILYPTQNAVKTYVDAQVTGSATPDATTVLKGKVQLAGDLGGPGTLAAAPVISNNAITTIKIADANVTDAKIVAVSGSKITGNIAGNAATVTTNANLTGPVTSTGNATAIANGAITNAMLANGAVANLSGTNTGDQTNIAGNAATVTTNANLTGEVTSVGNAATLGSFTSSSLSTALTNETGTGTVVFATSPTLVTPALGTPTALVGTNITGTAAGLTSGNVTTNANLTGPVTSIGNATSIANGAITNAMLANGAVANLSGTNTGDQTLSGLGGVGGSGTLNYVPKFTPDGTTLGNSLIFDDGTNVGIGTITPSEKLHISNGNIRLGSTLTGNSIMFYPALAGTETYVGEILASGGATNMQWITKSGSDILLSPGGNVGIGVTSTAAKLDIAGTSGTTLKIVDGNQGAGKVLTSDATGVASWAAAGGGSGWSLTGNAGTVDGTNFIGTTDNIPFNIRVNNEKAGRIDVFTAGNTFFGYRSGNANSGNNFNTGIGQQALFSNTTGYNNTASGYNALASNTTGWNNTASGFSALQSNTTGNHNTASGVNALNANTIGFHNTANGLYVLQNNTTGYDNTASGARALYSNTIGSRNTASGSNALFSNTEGVLNTASGLSALQSNTTGGFNTASGFNALSTNTTGSYNTAIGNNANVSLNNLTNATAIGNGAIVTASNNMWFGNTAVVGWGFGVAPGADAIRVGTDGTNGNGATLTVGGIWTNASDRTKKHDIKNISYGLPEVMKLRPVTYKMNGTNYQDIGFLAQEVKEIFPEIVYGEEGQMTISYGQITSVLTKAIQEQQKVIEELKMKNEKLEMENNTFKSQISTINEQLSIINSQLGTQAQK